MHSITVKVEALIKRLSAECSIKDIFQKIRLVLLEQLNRSMLFIWYS